MKKIESQITQRMAKYLGVFRPNKNSLDREHDCCHVEGKLDLFWISLENRIRDFLGGPWLRLRAPNEGGGQSSIPGQGTRPHMPQQRVCRSQRKDPCATTKTQHSQINKLKK